VLRDYNSLAKREKLSLRFLEPLGETAANFRRTPAAAQKDAAIVLTPPAPAGTTERTRMPPTVWWRPQ
jgi:hypothetical protein